MRSARWNVCWVCAFLCFAAITSPGRTDEGEPDQQPADGPSSRRFRELVHAGQWATWEHGELRLFSHEEKDRAILLYTDRRAGKLSEFLEKLEQVGELSEAGDVKGAINSALEAVRRPAGAVPEGAFYEVSEVGRDYVGLRRGQTERFIQLSFVETIARTAAAKPAGPSALEPARIRHQLGGLSAEIQVAMRAIAVEEVNIARLDRELTKSASRIESETKAIELLRTALKTEKDPVTINGREYTAAEVQKDLIKREQFLRATQESRQRLQLSAEARKAALANLQIKLGEVVQAKRDLEVSLEPKSADIENQIDATLRRLESIRKRLEQDSSSP